MYFLPLISIMDFSLPLSNVAPMEKLNSKLAEYPGFFYLFLDPINGFWASKFSLPHLVWICSLIYNFRTENEY